MLFTALNTTPLNDGDAVDLAVGKSTHTLVVSTGEAHTESIGYGDTIHSLLVSDGEGDAWNAIDGDSYSYPSVIYGEGWVNEEAEGDASYELLESDGQAWPVQSCDSDSLYSFISYGVGWQPAACYGEFTYPAFVSSGWLDVSNYCVAISYLYQSEGEGSSISVVTGSSTYKSISSGQTDIFRFAAGSSLEALFISYGVGYVVHPGIGDTVYEREESVGVASTSNWGNVAAAMPVQSCSGAATAVQDGTVEAYSPIFKSTGVIDSDSSEAYLAYTRCTTTVSATVDPSAVTTLHYERCS